MGLKVYGERLETADLTPNLRVFQNVKFNKNIILLACRIDLIVVGDPTFNSLSMDIYSVDNGLPKKLLHSSSNSLSKAQIHTLANGMKGIYFEFNLPVFKSSDWYSFVLKGVGYSGLELSHLAWRKAWPDPVYRTGLANSYEELIVSPYAINFVGANL